MACEALCQPVLCFVMPANGDTKIERVRRQSAREVLAYLDSGTELYSTIGRQQMPLWLFRGHAVESWKLHASLVRGWVEPAVHYQHFEFMASIETTDGAKPLGPDPTIWDVKDRRQLVDSSLSEMGDRVAAFGELAGHVGLLTGSAAAEATQLLNWSQDAIGPPVVPRAIALTALAQHHGISTTLLDWTRNRYVALWFACRDVVRQNLHRSDGTAAVWAVPRLVLPKHKRIHYFTVLDQSFAHAQGGCFTYDEGAVSEFVQTGAVRDLEDQLCDRGFFQAASHAELPFKLAMPFQLQFPHKIAPELLAYLSQRHVSLANLMPTLANVAKEVNQQEYEEIWR